MSWVASLEVRLDGSWVTLSAVRNSRRDAWVWLESKMAYCYKVGYKYRHIKITKERAQRYDPGQFEFLRGNEQCAREWQDCDFRR